MTSAPTVPPKGLRSSIVRSNSLQQVDLKKTPSDTKGLEHSIARSNSLQQIDLKKRPLDTKSNSLLKERPFDKQWVTTSSPWWKAAAPARVQVLVVNYLLMDTEPCMAAKDLQWGKVIHAKSIESQNENIAVVMALIKMYAKCNSMVEARCVFDSISEPDVVCWTALILAYAENGEGLVALHFFSVMKAYGCVPDAVTYVAAVKSCTSLAENGHLQECYEQGRKIHLEVGSHLNHYVKNSLVDMYAKSGKLDKAREVFDGIQKPDVVSWNTIIMGYADNGEGNVALDMFSRMKSGGHVPNSLTYLSAIKACTSLAMSEDDIGKTHILQLGGEIHLEMGSHLNRHVEGALLHMYTKCGSMVEARCIFDRMHKPNVVSWTALLLGYAENGEGQVALELFSRMKLLGCEPNSLTFVAVVKACASLADNGDYKVKLNCLEQGREIHGEIGCHLNHYVQSTLIDMYAKCNSMVDSREVFDSIEIPDVIAWTALLLGYAESGEGEVTLKLFSRMKETGCVPNSLTYLAALKACTSIAAHGNKGDALEQGREVHSEIGTHSNRYLQSALLEMYAKCDSMLDACRLFESLQEPDVVCWNALLMGFAENGQGLTSLAAFSTMKSRGCIPTSLTYVAALKACGIVGALALGRKLHSEIREFTSHIVAALVGFYAKCGSMVEAREVFDLHPKSRDVATWSVLIAGYGRFGDFVSAFDLFEAMKDEGVVPDALTFMCILLCCSHAGYVEKGRVYFEAMCVEYGLTPAAMHYTCMVDVLGRANHLSEAIGLLQDVPCNSDAVTWRSLLSACRKWKNVEIGRIAFQSLVDLVKIDSSSHVLMAHIYGSNGMWEEQERILEQKRRHDDALQV